MSNVSSKALRQLRYSDETHSPEQYPTLKLLHLTQKRNHESAYSQSPDSRNHDLPSLQSSRYCLDRSMGIAYGRPSGPHLSTKKRVISLTSVSSTGKIKAIMFGDKLRLVSMPERGRYANVSAKDSLLEIPCIDDLDDYQQMDRLYPADLPQTPSPPSSPESVDIMPMYLVRFFVNPGIQITMVSRHRYQIHQSTHYLWLSGWVAWTNSPPRPIPALHGPSSLPYARCPS